MTRQCSSCGGFCKKSGCERENVPIITSSDVIAGLQMALSQAEAMIERQQHVMQRAIAAWDTTTHQKNGDGRLWQCMEELRAESHNSIADVHEAARLLEAARALPVDGLDAEPVQPNRDWDHIDDVLPVIELMRSGKWVWDENMRCKYVEVRIDTRDGGCIIKDRHDVRITPAELVKQFDGRGGLSWTEYDEIFSPPIAKQQEPS